MEDKVILKEKIVSFYNKYKEYVIGIGVVIIVVVVLLLNMNFIQITYYKMAGETTSLVNILSKEITKESNQQKLYFKVGMDYLLESFSDETKAFLENRFLDFDAKTQQQILKKYNEEKVLFTANKNILMAVAVGAKEKELVDYVKRIPVDIFERELMNYFNEKGEVNLKDEVIEELYNMISIYPTKLPMDKFKMDIYSLLNFYDEKPSEKIEALLGCFEPEAVKRELVKSLKTEAVSLDTLNAWIQLLNKKGAITSKEYAGFTAAYTEVTQLKNQYRQLEEQEVDLKNLQAKVYLEIEKFTKRIEEKKKEEATYTDKIAKAKETLNKLENYDTMALYILDYYGDGEYEAAIPKKSLFFDSYKPSNEKVVVKLKDTEMIEQGVVTVNVYKQGAKQVDGANKAYPYVVEVSKEDKVNITAAKEEMQTNQDFLTDMKQNIKGLEQEIEVVKQAKGFAENEALLENVAKGKLAITDKLEEKRIEVQLLLGIGNVKISS